MRKNSKDDSEKIIGWAFISLIFITILHLIYKLITIS